MTLKQKTLLLRFARTLGATVIASVVGFLGGHDLLGSLTPTEGVVVSGVLIPFLATAEKSLRFGSDPGEGAPDAADAAA